MFVQWAIKGISGGGSGINDETARWIIDAEDGIRCNWWRNKGRITCSETRAKLTAENLRRHVNEYDGFSRDTPFVSLTAGCVERDAAVATNRTIPARRTALQFATESGTQCGYLFYCWVIVALKQAVQIEGVAEEVRELNTYRSFSWYQTEGEITAKVQIPSNQIQKCEKYKRHDPAREEGMPPEWIHPNPKFVEPTVVSNIRGVI